MALRELMTAFADVIVPPVCVVCSRTLVAGERHICLDCLADIPLTGINGDGDSPLHQRLATTSTPIERVASWFYYYRGSDYAPIIHNAKYNGRPSVARDLAAAYARSILPTGFFDGIDMIAPVPLHLTRRLRRGYNQSLHIARGISEATGIAVAPVLRATRRHSSQTKRGAYLRWLNATGAYSVDTSADLERRHILIVDDVLTTGATVLACADAIHKAFAGAKVSVLTLAATERT